MPRSVFSEAYASVVTKLVALRKERGVNQVELARRLGKTQQFISAVENGDRRIDIVEFYAFAKALGADPVDLFAQVAGTFPERVAI